MKSDSALEKTSKMKSRTKFQTIQSLATDYIGKDWPHQKEKSQKNICRKTL